MGYMIWLILMHFIRYTYTSGAHKLNIHDTQIIDLFTQHNIVRLCGFNNQTHNTIKATCHQSTEFEHK